ncbi:MAG TPA: hypothetical protein VND54_02845 [Candidatus Saccharimonadales bacterium]|nr:hypothetical protein [Candidatus Saccharimonadales bacterium]
MRTDTIQKGTRLTVMVIEGVLGIAAVSAGLLFIAQPDGSLLGMSTATLTTTPFSDYTVPGVLLALVVGGGTLLAAWAVRRRARNAAELVLASGMMLVFFELVEEVLIGLNPQQPVIVFAGVVLIALALRLAGPMQAAEVALTDGNVTVRFPGASALLEFKRPLEIPIDHVLGVERASEEAREQRQGIFGLGAWLPSVITAPRFHHPRGSMLWNVSDPANAIVIELREDHHSRVVIDVADPDETIATIRAAIAGRTLSAA